MKKSGGRYTRYKVSYGWEGDCEMGENKMPHIWESGMQCCREIRPGQSGQQVI